ncbi:MBOAT family protein, partial [Pseudanabaenaceae cyanobacterium LEGE 13415]|nr:MBOAT family protein [Pseudanabaenaceae cyanobacterium LEGE 13415]
PLGGAKVPWVACNIMIVFAVSGLWHGAGWNFAIWGIYHGSLLVFHRYVGRSLKLPKLLAWLLTFTAVMFGWLFFMETNLERLSLKLQTLVMPKAYSIANLSAIEHKEFLLSMIGLCTAFLIIEQIANWQQKHSPYDWFLSHGMSRFLLGCTIVFASVKASSEFIYFAF